MSSNNINAFQSQEKEVSFDKTLKSFLSNWPWFVVFVILACGLAFLYNEYTPSRYRAKTSILLNDQNSSANPTDLLFGSQDLGIVDDVINQSIIIKSFPLLKQSIEELNLNFVYYRVSPRLSQLIEIYDETPFYLEFDSLSERKFLKGVFYVEFENQNSFRLTSEDWNLDEVHQLRQPITINGVTFRLFSRTDARKTEVIETTDQFAFELRNIDVMVYGYHNRLEVSRADKRSSILELSLAGTTSQKQIDFLNTLCRFYIDSDLREKNQVVTKTISFIEEQLVQMRDSLGTIEDRLEAFKIRESISDLGLQTTRVLDQVTKLESQKAELIARNKYYDYLEEYLSSGNSTEQIRTPTAFGVTDPVLTKLTTDWITLYLERNALTNTGKGQNPLVNQLNSRMSNIGASLKESVKNLRAGNEVLLNDIEGQIGEVETVMSSLPASERELINIQRLYSLTESLYLLLLEKNSEAQITRSSNTPDYRVIEPARLDGLGPISPSRTLNYLLAVMLGFLLPGTIVILRSMFDRRIKAKSDVEEHKELVLLGEIPNNSIKKISELVQSPRSSIAEAFRVIRSNLNFVSKTDNNNTIVVSSNVPGEGKTFVSSGLATIFGLMGKKVLVIDADLRKPSIYKMFDLPNDIGFTSSLIGELPIQEVIQTTTIPNVDVITSGPIPPNPADLLSEGPVKRILDELNQVYDIIIIDTPPFGLVTDALLLMQLVSTNLVILRQNYSTRDALKNTVSLQENEKLGKIAVVLNSASGSRKYGYGNGYYEEKKKRSFGLKRLFRKE